MIFPKTYESLRVRLDYEQESGIDDSGTRVHLVVLEILRRAVREIKNTTYHLPGVKVLVVVKPLTTTIRLGDCKPIGVERRGKDFDSKLYKIAEKYWQEHTNCTWTKVLLNHEVFEFVQRLPINPVLNEDALEAGVLSLIVRALEEPFAQDLGDGVEFRATRQSMHRREHNQPVPFRVTVGNVIVYRGRYDSAQRDPACSQALRKARVVCEAIREHRLGDRVIAALLRDHTPERRKVADALFGDRAGMFDWRICGNEWTKLVRITGGFHVFTVQFKPYSLETI